jgi:hypothetical protein
MNFIPDDIFDNYYKFIDELYTNNHISEKVKLVYLTKDNCPNCIPGHPNKYNGTGSTPFSFGPCPVCNGNNYIQSKTEEEVNLRIYVLSLRKKENTNISNTSFSNGEIQIIGKMENMHKIIKADYFNIFSNMSFDDFRYELSTSPIPFGFGSSQFMCYARRK